MTSLLVVVDDKLDSVMFFACTDEGRKRALAVMDRRAAKGSSSPGGIHMLRVAAGAAITRALLEGYTHKLKDPATQ
jgi:hypothetical protein